MAIFALLACTAPKNERCVEICKRQDDCIDRTGTREQYRLDRTACTTICTALDRDEAGQKTVDYQETCTSQPACEDVLKCISAQPEQAAKSR